jgi:methyltransferase
MNLVLLATLVIVPMLFEAALSRHNERQLRAMGAAEPHDDVYWLMQGVYPAAFLAMLLEGWLHGPVVDVHVAAGFAVFVGAKLLKYWSITSLGVRWTFRVLVPPGSTRTLVGPYKLLRHPNYIAVMGELAGAALVAHAPLAGGVAGVAFGALILLRIRVEERALGLRGQ